MWIRYLSVLFLISTQSAHALSLQVGDIKDSRTTGQFFSELEVELKLIGDELADAKAVRASVSSASDSTGRDIMDPEKLKNEFKELGSKGFGNNVTLKFKNPSRKADSLKEIKGTVELYIPKNDPASTVRLSSFKNVSGKPVDSPALRAAGIELSLMTPAQAEEKQKKDAEAKAAEMRAKGMSDGMIQMATQLVSGFGGSNGHSVTIHLKDPQKRLVGIEFQSAAGEEIASNGSMTSGDKIVRFLSEPMPDNAQVMIHIASPKSLVSVPLQLTDVALP